MFLYLLTQVTPQYYIVEKQVKTAGQKYCSNQVLIKNENVYHKSRYVKGITRLLYSFFLSLLSGVFEYNTYVLKISKY